MKKKMRTTSTATAWIVCTFIALLPFQAVATVDTETITVTATKSAKNIDGVTASVDIISGAEICAIGADSLKDIFEKTPGLTIQYGTFPAASAKSKSSISIRGLGATGTLFLLDGRRLAGEVKNPYDMDRIPASIIERIEIIKGPMSVLYGADAIGGVVNIITKKVTEQPSGAINVQGGANDDGDGAKMNADLSVRGKKGKFGYSLYANALKTEPYEEAENTTTMIKTASGFVPPSAHPHPQINQIQDSYAVDVSYREESEVYTLGGRFTFDLLNNTTVGAEFNYFTEERDGDYRSTFFPTGVSPAPGQRIAAFDTPVHSHDDNERLDFGADLKSAISTDLTLNFRIYNSYYEKRNTTTASNWEQAGYASEEASESLGMNADVDIWSYEGYAVYALGDSHLLTGGGEYRDEEREATVFNQAGTPETRSVDYTAFYLQDEWQISNSLSTTFGARYDDISNADNKTTFKVGAVNKFSEQVIVRANFAQGYRSPDIRELYIRKNTPAGAQRGSSVVDTTLGKVPYDLQPELLNSYEIGISGKNAGWHYSAALFYNEIEDMISQVTKNSGTPSTYYTFENISDATTSGLELAVGYNFASGLGLDLNWAELDTENDQTGEDLEFNPERQVSATLNYMQDSYNLWISGKYIGEQYAEVADDDTIDSYFLTNVGGTLFLLEKQQLELYGGVNNIFDESVDTLLGSSVGPYVYAGIRYNF